ncbi:MAG: hybrid sensor histidine kinase/response regulator [Pseudomonadales bacterium]
MTKPSSIRTRLLALAGTLAGSLVLLLTALIGDQAISTAVTGPNVLLIAAALLGGLGLWLVGRLYQLTSHQALLSNELQGSGQQDPHGSDKTRSDGLIGPVSESTGEDSGAPSAPHFPPNTQAHLLHDIIDQIPYPVFALDQQGQVLFVNAALAALYNTTPQKLAHYQPDGHLRRLSSDDLLTRPADNAEGEEWLTTLDGEERRYLVQRLPFHSQIEGELVVAVDVTELHKLQLQLQFSQRLEVLGTLAGGIAHDFNNLLTPILGYSSILLESDLEPTHLRKVQAIATSANRARKVAQQMLSFSRQHDDLDAKEQVDLAAIIVEAVTFMKASVPPHIDIQTDLQASPWINADSGQLHQVLVNLCTNATQAIAASNGQVLVRCQELSSGDPALPTLLRHCDCALIEVIDNGTGMSKAVMNHVFEPFFTTKEVGEGSGLGLSIVKGIVTRHGGTIDVSSSKETGTSFRVYLPTAKLRSFEPTRTGNPEPRLLLVDDDDMVLRVLEDLLKTRGFAVTAFSDPQTALAHLSKAANEIDVMITDNNMPKMKGVDLARSARQIVPDLPIILITGFARPSDTELSNISRNLMKPVSSKDLTDAIRAVTTEHQAA